MTHERREFLTVIAAEEAHRRLREAVPRGPLGREIVPLADALGRVLAVVVTAPLDVPGFDRANVDGFALRAADTFGADEATPCTFVLNDEQLTPGIVPTLEVRAGTATPIATGGVLPRGADAVVMVEHTRQPATGRVEVLRALAPGAAISFAGSDLARGERVLAPGVRLTARETGTLAALGLDEVSVFRRPRVAVISTGDELVTPGSTRAVGQVHDSNRRILIDMLRELGCEPLDLGVVADDLELLRAAIERGLEADVVLLSGGTSKGEGDLCARAVDSLAQPLCHGVAVKPGKPLCLAVRDGKPVVVLPGFPTSAVFTFGEFVVPLLLEMAGAPGARPGVVRARVPARINSEPGRTEFLLVGLIESPAGLTAYPMGKGSGSVTTYTRADGYITIPQHCEFLEADEEAEVRLLARDVRAADLVVIGSHCPGLDILLELLQARGLTTKCLLVGSHAGLLAAQRGECDLAGVHLLGDDGVYNRSFAGLGLELVPGYGRMQGVVFRRSESEPELREARMVNRNAGSGTRILIDELLGDARPPGYHLEARSHNAVAAAVSQGRADWGVTIAPVAGLYDLSFRPLREERFDFLVPVARRGRPAVQAFCQLLVGAEARERLQERGFNVDNG